MPPRAKRPRSNSESSTERSEIYKPTEVTNASSDDAKLNLKPHEKLWFEDGNIVLATDVHLYCVHKGVLANSSVVFKEMLELPNVGEKRGAYVDEWAGMPLVKMVGDSDEDVYQIPHGIIQPQASFIFYISININLQLTRPRVIIGSIGLQRPPFFCRCSPCPRSTTFPLSDPKS